jgi:DnaK suppressor protein
MTIQVNAAAGLTLSQLEELANRMVDMRHQLVDILDGLNRQNEAKDDCSLTDAADAAGLQEERTRAIGLADQHRKTIIEIDDALKRLQNGCFGISETSGESIAYERLLLIPWARTGSND